METATARGHSLLLYTTTALLLVFITLLAAIHSSNAAQQKEHDVNPISRSEIDTASIPPIDTAAPSLVKTASFGLG